MRVAGYNEALNYAILIQYNCIRCLFSNWSSGNKHALQLRASSMGLDLY